MHKKVNYKIVLDVEQDAWNWRDAYNKSSHGMDWGKLMPVEVREQLDGKSDKEADEYLIAYLKQKYIDEKDSITRRKRFIESEFEQKFALGCAKIVEMMGKPIHTEEFTLF